MAMNSVLRIFLAFASMLIVPTTLAQSPARLEVIVFPGGFNWPIWVAQEKGFFRENGVEVNITPTPGSVFQLVNLIDGKFDIAITAIDNLIAYREGQGEDPKVGSDLVAVMGADQGFLKLVTVPEITSIGELRGNIAQGDGVYKSADGGKTWMHIGLTDTQTIAKIRVHPTNPDVVYVAAFGHPAGPNKERGH